MVLLHGFLETSKIWEPFIKELSNKRQVVCVDLPGHGQTGNFGEIHSMELMAEVVNAVLEHLNVSKATFLGHSMGGYVCLAFAEKYPDKISGLVLLNSTPEADSEERKIMRDKAIQVVFKNKAAYIKTAFSNLVAPGNEIKFKKEIDELKQEAFNQSKEGIIAALMGMKIRTTRIDLLKQLTSYKFMVLGLQDPVLTLNIAKSIAALSKCPVILLEGGHLSYIESNSSVRQIVHFID